MKTDRGAVLSKDKQLGGRRHSWRREGHIFGFANNKLEKTF